MQIILNLTDHQVEILQDFRKQHDKHAATPPSAPERELKAQLAVYVFVNSG